MSETRIMKDYNLTKELIIKLLDAERIEAILSERKIDYVRLRVVEGLSFREIGKRYGYKTDSVKESYGVALRKLGFCQKGLLLESKDIPDDMPISRIGISNRVVNSLWRLSGSFGKVETFGELKEYMKLPEEVIMKRREMGVNGYNELYKLVYGREKEVSSEAFITLKTVTNGTTTNIQMWKGKEQIDVSRLTAKDRQAILAIAEGIKELEELDNE